MCVIIVIITIFVCCDVFAEEFADLHAHIKLFNKENTTPRKKVTKISQFAKFQAKSQQARNAFRKYINCFKFTAS